MPEANIKIINQLGLHARAAAQLVRLAGSFKARVTLVRLDNQVVADAKSILSVLTLAAGKGTELKLTVEGVDEQTAFDSIREIFAKGFGEI
ncbi:MAG TPA: HPr family phosphocarrier protein [Pyrinomonadaceae bacterium]|jgi:phosphotransferase system HPr (HPr) family protein